MKKLRKPLQIVCAWVCACMHDIVGVCILCSAAVLLRGVNCNLYHALVLKVPPSCQSKKMYHL